jgi:hypothetical protein
VRAGCRPLVFNPWCLCAVCVWRGGGKLGFACKQLQVRGDERCFFAAPPPPPSPSVVHVCVSQLTTVSTDDIAIVKIADLDQDGLDDIILLGSQYLRVW